MPRSAVSMNFAKVVVRREYYWPEIHLTIWTIFMIIAGLFLITNFASLSGEQARLQLGVPWVITYGLTVAVLTEVFVWAGLFLSFQRNLLPGVVILYAFILLVLYLAGMIGTAMQLFGPVITACRKNDSNHSASGLSYDTLIWLNQHDTCQRWYVVFSFWVSGSVMLVWMLFVARGVLSEGS